MTWHAKHCFSKTAAGVPVPSWQRLHSNLTTRSLPRAASPAGSSGGATGPEAEAVAVEAEAPEGGPGAGLLPQESASAAARQRVRALFTAPCSFARVGGAEPQV